MNQSKLIEHAASNEGVPTVVPDIECIELDYCNLTDRVFHDLRSVTLQYSTSSRALFIASHITNTRFDFALLSDADFSNAIIDGCSFNGADLLGTVFNRATVKASFERATIESVKFIRSILHIDEANHLTFNNVDFTGATIVGNFFHCTFNNCSFDQADTSGVTCEDCSFEGQPRIQSPEP